MIMQENLAVVFSNSHKLVYDKRIAQELLITDYVIGYCSQGRLTLSINGVRHNYQQGDGLILFPGSSSCVHEVSDDYYGIYLLIGEQIAHNTAKSQETIYYQYLWDNPLCALREDEQQLLKKFLETVSIFLNAKTANSLDNFALNQLIGSIQLKIGGIFLAHAQEMDQAHSDINDDILVFKQFLSYLDKNHSTERSVAFYADHAHLTLSSFSRLVKRVSGQSAKYWINKALLESCLKLLQQPDLAIVEVVQKLHFSSPSVFNLFFKNQMGISPTAYREQLHSDSSAR